MYNMFTYESEGGRDLQFPISFRNEGLLQLTGSHVAYSVKQHVVISRKRCQFSSRCYYRPTTGSYMWSIEQRQFR